MPALWRSAARKARASSNGRRACCERSRRSTRSPCSSSATWWRTRVSSAPATSRSRFLRHGADWTAYETRCPGVSCAAAWAKPSAARDLGLLAFADLVELIRGMARLFVHGRDGLLGPPFREAENLSSFGVEPVAHVLNPGTLLRFDILRMRFGELLRSHVHPIVYVHECRHEPTSCSLQAVVSGPYGSGNG